MGVLVEAAVPAEQFALPEINSDLEDVEFRAVRLVAHGSDRVAPFMWISGDGTARLAQKIADDQCVSGVDVLAEFEDESLVRIDWKPRVRVFASILEAEQAVILGLSGKGGTWYFRLFFPDEDLVVATTELCEEYGVDVSIERTSELSGVSEYGCFGLTERQYETVVSAYEYGYYDVPRSVTQEELAEHFGVSHQALSERLRRAHEALITSTLFRTIQRQNRSVSIAGT